MRPIEPINRLIQTQSKLQQFTIHKIKNREILGKEVLYTNNIQKHYSVSRCVISIIIVIAPTHSFLGF